MITVSSNLSKVLGSFTAKLKTVSEPQGVNRDKMLRTIAFDLAATMKERIHSEGKNSDDQQIGEYSNKYLKVREKNRRGNDKKVILSLTRLMENDFNVIGGDGSTGYDLGFKNDLNKTKADAMENGIKPHTVKEHNRNVKGKTVKVKSYNNSGWEGYGDIYKPTVKEQNAIRKAAEQFISDLLK